MNTIEGALKLRGDEKIAIISSRFNHIITDRLVEGARDCFLRHGGNEDLLDLVLVPGAYEIPFVLQKLPDLVQPPQVLGQLGKDGNFYVPQPVLRAQIVQMLFAGLPVAGRIGGVA